MFVIQQGACVGDAFIFGILTIACFQALVFHAPRASPGASADLVRVQPMVLRLQLSPFDHSCAGEHFLGRFLIYVSSRGLIFTGLIRLYQQILAAEMYLTNAPWLSSAV